MSSLALDPDWRMTSLFLLALASVGVMMKLVVLAGSGVPSQSRRSFIFSPFPSPGTRERALPFSEAGRFVRRTLLFAAAAVLYYWIYWRLVGRFDLRGALLSYLAAPVLLLIGELLVAVVVPLWLPSGRLLPPLHRNPLGARSVADFWGRRWNLWFSDWFRSAVFSPWRRRPVLALFLVFVVSGALHEWVVNVPLYVVTGRRLFGSMMLYFLLQAAGVLVERCFLKGHPAMKITWAWLVVYAPVPLLANEGLLRTLHFWPA